MTLTIEGKRIRQGGTHSYLSVTLDDKTYPLPFTEFWVLLILTSRHLQGVPKVSIPEIWGVHTARYINRTKAYYKKVGLPVEILNSRDGHYSIRFPKEIDVQIKSTLLKDQDARVRDEVKRYLYATVGVASC